MWKRTMTLLSAVMAVTLTGLLPACDIMDPGEGEFVQACLEESKRGFKKSQGGANDKEICQCAAQEARASLSPDSYRAMILEMQGKKQEAREITSKKNPDDQMAMLKGTLEMFGKCAMGGL